jgi:hypothetical protein
VIEHDGFAVACGWADPWPFEGASASQIRFAIGAAIATIALADHGALHLRFDNEERLQVQRGSAFDQLDRLGHLEAALLERAGSSWLGVATLFPTFPAVKPSEWRSGAWSFHFRPSPADSRADIREALSLCTLLTELAAPVDSDEDAPDTVLQALLVEGVRFAKTKGVP